MSRCRNSVVNLDKRPWRSIVRLGVTVQQVAKHLSHQIRRITRPIPSGTNSTAEHEPDWGIAKHCGSPGPENTFVCRHDRLPSGTEDQYRPSHNIPRANYVLQRRGGGGGGMSRTLPCGIIWQFGSPGKGAFGGKVAASLGGSRSRRLGVGATAKPGHAAWPQLLPRARPA